MKLQIWGLEGWARKRKKVSKSTRNRNMKESIIVYMEIWFNVFLMPPIPKALRFSFPFLMAWEINVNQIKKRYIFIRWDTVCWLQARKRKNERAWEQWEWEHGGKPNLFCISPTNGGFNLIWSFPVPPIPITLKHSFLILLLTLVFHTYNLMNSG
jgi:hypothetical protein